MKQYPDNSLLIMITDTIVGSYRDNEAPYPIIYVEKENLLEMMRLLQSEARLDFNRLPNVTSVDCKTYFEMVYTLYSVRLNHWITVKVKLDHDNPVVPSVTKVYASAEFEEREVYDLMGIDFEGHPDKRRILLPDDFEGNPLRKDYKQKHRPFVQRVKRNGGC